MTTSSAPATASRFATEAGSSAIESADAAVTIATAGGRIADLAAVEQVPALLIVLPILASILPLVAGLRSDEVGWPIAAPTLLVETGLAAWVVSTVLWGGHERVIHNLGGYPRQYGIELVVDAYSALVVALIAWMSLAVLAFARTAGPRTNRFYAGYLLLVGGLMGVTLTGDAFNMFVFLEITGIATYALVASGRSPTSAVASLKYLLIGTVGASLFLVGVGYAFAATGTLNMIELADALAGEGAVTDEPIYDDPRVLASFGLIATGLMVKSAIYPLHTWQPDAYAAAPHSVTALISALASTVGAYALGRMMFTVFTVDFFAAVPEAALFVVAMATVSVLAGSALAVIQRDVKRMFAYSSVAQFGLVVAAFGLAAYAAGGDVAALGDSGRAGQYALVGAMVHLVGHGLMKGGAFLAVGVVAYGAGARTIDEYGGLARRRPFTAGALAVLGLGLVGVPPTIGFVGKWFIALGAVETELWPVVVVIVASTLLTLGYVARLLEKMYFDELSVEPAPAPGRSGPEPGAGPQPGVAADGGDDPDRSDDPDAVADGGAGPKGNGPDAAPADADFGVETSAALRNGADPLPTGRVTAGMFGAAVVMAALTVALGFAGGGFAELLEPITEVFLE